MHGATVSACPFRPENNRPRLAGTLRGAPFLSASAALRAYPRTPRLGTAEPGPGFYLRLGRRRT